MKDNPGNGVKNNLDRVLKNYVAAFETLNPDAVIPFYQLPCMFIAPQNQLVVHDLESARAVVVHLMGQAKTQAYHRTEIRDVKLRQLAADLASVRGMYVRFNAAAEEISRFGFTYILREDAGAWKIAVAVAHDVSATVV